MEYTLDSIARFAKSFMHTAKEEVVPHCGMATDYPTVTILHTRKVGITSKNTHKKN